MAILPMTIAALQAHPGFVRARKYLYALLPDYPRFPQPTVFANAFAARGWTHETDAFWDAFHEEEVAQDNALQQPVPQNATQTSSAPVRTAQIVPDLIEDMISVWLLSSAKESPGPRPAEPDPEATNTDAYTALPTLPGLYVLHVSACPTISPLSIESVFTNPQARTLWDDQQLHGVGRLAEVEVISRTPGQERKNNGDNHAQKAARLIDIRKKLLIGKRVFLCCIDAQDIPADLDALVLRRFDLPGVTPDLVYALHGLIYPERPRLSENECSAVTSLHGISLTDLALALCYDEVVPAPALLARMAHAAESSKVSAPVPEFVVELENIVGNSDAVTLCLQIQRDFEAWDEGVLAWTDVPNGLFFYGPPGSGKTFLAAALAKSSGYDLFTVSYADCAATQRGSSGIIEHLFGIGHNAAASRRAVVFIDEIDGFAQSRFGKQDHNSSYYRTLTTGLLRFVDSLRTSPGVILVAATNDVAAVDPALLRAGRFDHHVALGTPDLLDIEVLLQRDLPNLPKAAITSAARQLLGASLADISAIARHVRSQARIYERQPEAADLTTVLKRMGADDMRYEEDLYRISVHETGHVIVDYVQTGNVAEKISLSAREGSVVRRRPLHYTKDQMHDALCILLAGRVAENLVLGTVSSGAGEGKDSDLSRATFLAARSRLSWHLWPETDLIWQNVTSELSTQIDPGIRAEIGDLLRACAQVAHDILARHQHALRRFAEVLISAREMRHAEIKALLHELIPNPAWSDQTNTDQASTGSLVQPTSNTLEAVSDPDGR